MPRACGWLPTYCNRIAFLKSSMEHGTTFYAVLALNEQFCSTFGDIAIAVLRSMLKRKTKSLKYRTYKPSSLFRPDLTAKVHAISTAELFPKGGPVRLVSVQYASLHSPPEHTNKTRAPLKKNEHYIFRTLRSKTNAKMHVCLVLL